MIRIAFSTMGSVLIGMGAWGQAADAGKKFIESLDETAAQKATFEFEDDTERKDWSNLPAPMHPRNGWKSVV